MTSARPTPATLPHRSWTFALDESGNFEDGQDHRLVGGVLLPGNAEESNRQLAPFRQWCEQRPHLGWPIHANTLNVTQKQELQQVAAQTVRDLGGYWLFVIAHARDTRDPQPGLGTYVRTLAVTIDLAGRLVAYLGGDRLDLRPAQRTIVLKQPALEQGFVTRSPTQDGKARAMSEAEVRAALDALRREPAGALPPAPEPGSVRADSATQYRAAHFGLGLADAGCNFVYGALRAGRDGLAHLHGPFQPAFLVSVGAARSMRAIDRALRETPPSLVNAAKIVAHLVANTAATAHNPGDTLALREGAQACSEFLWTHAGDALSRTGDANECCRSLAGLADIELAARSGSFEGLWLALQSGWCGSGALAMTSRAKLRDRALVARLWRMTLECANHRGDVQAAALAVREFEALATHGRSLQVLAEEFHVRNLVVVAAQNELPSLPEHTERVIRNLEDRTHELQQLAAKISGIVSSFGAARQMTRSDTDNELRLWKSALGTEPAWAAPDREQGMSWGTIARSWAFCGRLDEALRAAFQARACFGDSPADLHFNAAVIARIELERCRIVSGSPQAGELALDAALLRCEATQMASQRRLPAFQATPALRFRFDILLRALLWASKPSIDADSVITWLTGNELIGILSRAEMRSHPTELVARHAGELLRRRGYPAAISTRWFDLSLALCSESPADSTLPRLAPFTARLRDDPQFSYEGPPGSILHPTFEYR
jgi:hypothetical protein